jgi:hypothetical protein
MNINFIVRIEKAFVCIIILFFLLLFGLLILDLIQFISNPSDYEIVYKKNINDQSWARNYILQELVLIVGSIVIISLSFCILIKSTKKLRLSVYLVYLLLFILGITGYYKWYLTGFDH